MIKMKRLEEICSQFHKKRLLVFGDVIVDRYIFGEVERISPEAPVPVVRVTREENRLGGAGNVAANVDSLTARSILIGCCGDDSAASALTELKPDGDEVLRSNRLHTIIKTRIISGKQHIVRLDQDNLVTYDDPLLHRIQERIDTHIDGTDGLIVSDYAKGTVHPQVMIRLKQIARERSIPLIVDPKPAHAHMYKGVTGMTPNLREAEAMLNRNLQGDVALQRGLTRLRNRFQNRFLVITRGSSGISAGEKGSRWFHFPAFSHEVFDVTGAGDTVTAVLTLALISGADLREAVCLANSAASLVIEKIGTSRVSVDELVQRTRFLGKRH